MDGSQPSVARDANGRFVPGCSGNPAGKKPGTRNRATILREMLDDGEDRKLARIVIDKALAGDVVTARFLLDRLEPKPRGRPIHLDLPEGESAAGDVVACFNATLHAMAEGRITPDEAVLVSKFLEGRFRVLRAWQLEETLTRWSGRLPVPGDDFVPEGVPARERSPLDAAPRPSSPPANTSHFPSPPAERGERVAQGWRAAGEPYPELGEGGAAAAEMPDSPDTIPSDRTAAPHPAAAKLDDVSLSLRNPLPQGERGREDDKGSPEGERKPIIDAGRPPADYDPMAGTELRRLAIQLGLHPGPALHSACNSEAPLPRRSTRPKRP
jgi:hypothetical protein